MNKVLIRSMIAAYVLVSFLSSTSFAFVPVRISVKFILSASGTRPATGNINTDAEVTAEYDEGNAILAENMSEFRLDMIEFVDLSGVNQWYSSAATDTNRDNLRAAAIAAPATYLWRTNAINIYINGGTSSAISKFPPDNDIILMNQNCGNNPSCMLHELGHSLNLMHTHETCCTNQDECTDTISDNSGWTRNQIAQNSYGCLYADCSAAQRDAVDLVFNNIMSYHTGEPQRRISSCQKNRVSTQGDSDRSWLLAREPIYVNRYYTGLFEFGRFVLPYKTLQDAVDAGGLANKMIVLEGGGYTVSPPFSGSNTGITTRNSASSVSAPGVHLYTIPTDLENSETPEVSSAVRDVQREDNAARKIMKDAKEAVKAADTAEKRTKIMSDAKRERKKHHDAAIGHLMRAEKVAKGEEKAALQLEIAQRSRDEGDCKTAVKFFRAAASTTKQKYLKERAEYEAENCTETSVEAGEYTDEKDPAEEK